MVRFPRSGLLLTMAVGVGVALGVVAERWFGGWSGAAQDPALSIIVSEEENRLFVYEEGKLTHTYVVSVGMPEYRTPKGSYHITSVVWNPWWNPPKADWAKDEKATPPGPDNPMGRVKMNFAPQYYIHGTPHEESLGAPVSHGCVRMYEKDAMELAWIVVRYGKPGVSDAEIEEILAHTDRTETMILAHPIPVEIR